MPRARAGLEAIFEAWQQRGADDREDRVMRKVMPLLGVAVSVLAGCVQTTRWEKPQTSEQVAGADLEDCRLHARQEANRSVGPYPLRYPLYGSPYYRGWYSEYDARWRHEQHFTENRLASFCMRTKGYERVVVENQRL